MATGTMVGHRVAVQAAGTRSRIPVMALLVVAAAADAATVVGRVDGAFEATPFGAATYTIPVQVAAGTGGLKPDLALAYNSQAGDGMAGAGWTLTGLPQITRCPLTLAVDGRVQGVRFSSQDRFCLDGQPLVLVSGTYGGAGAEYRTEVHGHERVFSQGRQGSGPAWFELRQPDGLVQRFGNDADSRIEVAGGSEVRAWALNEIEDRFQQRIGVTYTEDSAGGEFYPAEVRWTYGAAEGPQQARLRLTFHWEQRPAAHARQGYQWGFPWRSSVRLSRIEYESLGDGGAQLVHRYTLGYAAAGSGGAQRSLLASVTQCGPVDCLPPTVMNWDRWSNQRESQSVEGPPTAGAVPGDFNGDGATDLYTVTNGVWKAWPADPRAGGFLAPVSVGSSGSAVSVGLPLDFNGDGLTDLLTGFADGWIAMLYLAPSRPGDPFEARNLGAVSPAAMEIQPMDLDGDGFDDLVYLRDGMAYVRRNVNGSLAAESASGIRAVAAPDAPFADGFGFIEPADLDGDGRMDMVVARSAESGTGNYRWEAYLSTGSGFAADPIATFTTPAAPGKVLIADINGDGLADVLRYADGAWRPLVSRGTGNAASPGLTPSACPAPVSAATATMDTILDYDGDGRADLLLGDPGWWRVYTSDGLCFSSQRYLDVPQAPRSTTGRPLPADFNGDGNADFALPDPATGNWFLSLYQAPVRTDGSPGAHRANLLQKITDGLGNFHVIAYEHLTGWSGYQPGSEATSFGRPVRGGPLQVVSAWVANSGIGNQDYSVSVEYAAGLTDRQGRGFLGFASTRLTDSRTGLATETAYAQAFPFTGRIEQATTWNGSRRVAVSDPSWTVVTTTVPDAARDVHFIQLAGETSESYETDPDGGYLGNLVRRSTRALTWNALHGAVVLDQTTVTAPQRSGQVLRTTRTITLDDGLRTSAGCLGFPSRVDTTQEDSGGPVETRTTQFTWQLTTCRPATRTEGPASLPAQQLRTTYAYDSAGRASGETAQDAAGQLAARQRRLAYDASAIQPVAEAVVISGEPDLVTGQAWHVGLGLPTSRVSPQGQATRWTYDDFGRLVTETRSPGSTRYTYTGCGPCFAPNARYAVRAQRSDGYWSESQHDGFGRIVGRSVVLADGRVSRQVVEYDRQGRVSRESVPYIEGDGGVYWTTYQYDLVGRPKVIDRPVSETQPSGATETYVYAGLETTVRDAELRSTLLTRDAGDRLVAVRDPLQATTTYAYTPSGKLSAVVDPGLHARQFRYDERGLLVESTDPDAGRRLYGYNAFGERVSQSDARSPPASVTWQYDQLGRVTRRVEPEGTTSWTYSAVAGPSRGLLSQVTGPTGTGAGGFQENFVYDARSRVQRVTTTIDGNAFQTDYSYDTESKVRSMTYPATVGWRPRFVFGYAFGQLNFIGQDNAGVAPIYTLVAMDAGGRDVRASFGFADFDEATEHDAATGRLVAIRSGTPAAPGSLQDYAYEWDRVGNLLSRQDLAIPQRTERFAYDSLNRLKQATLNGVTTLSMIYRPDGNIRNKSDVGNFAYGDDGTRPHAVTAVGGGPRGILTFDYDANGNMTRRAGQDITWTSFNLPQQINSPGGHARFDYGPGRNRIRQEARTGSAVRTTYYAGPHFEVEVEGAVRRYRSNVFAYGRAVYSQVETTPSGLEGYYVFHDHQGSVDRLARAVGVGSDRFTLSFDAWGKRRNPDWTADSNDQRYGDSHWTERGYTGHEHLDSTRLVHMNGRLQDPLLGRMLSPDPVLGSLLGPQSLNPYSYVANGPVAYFDPSGYFLSKLRKGFRRALRHVGSFGRRLVRRWGRQIVAAVAAYYTAGAVSSWAFAAQTGNLALVGSGAGALEAGATLGASYMSSAALGGMAGGAVAGAIATGSLRGAMVGAVTGGAMGGIGGAFGSSYSVGRVLAEGTVGGVGAELQGGDFGKGFLTSAGLSAGTWAALGMREQMIEQSRRYDQNASGVSDGFRGDRFKLGGSRWPSDGSILGGKQGGPGNFLGFEYEPGSFVDHLVETYAGPHDFLNNPFFYDDLGNNVSRSLPWETLNAVNVAIATPFAIASVIPRSAYWVVQD